MEIWRKKGDQFNQEFSRKKSNSNSSYHYKKPPIGANSNWQQNVPYWEKRFVYSVGSLSWKKFLEAKEFTHLYGNIMKWDDCAGERAFRTAKDRFYVRFHDLPCEVDQHNPDLYIDQIDWNAQVDQNLILDLESEPVVTDVDSQHEPVVIFGDVLLPDPYKDYSAYGWGDSDEKIKKSGGNNDGIKGNQNRINWDDYIDNGRIIWDDNVGGVNNDWWVWNETDNKAGDQGWNTNTYNNNDYYSSYGNGNNERHVFKAEDQDWNTNTYDNNNYYSSYGNGNNERHVSSHKTWCSHGNNDQRYRSWRNNGNRRSTGQGYGNQRGHGSTFQAHGSQRIHVHP